MKKIKLILVDGLGRKNIENLDNILTQNQTDKIVSTFPSSTSVALGSVNLGSDPLENGLIGYYHFEKSENKLINTFRQHFDFLIYGSWEGLDRLKRLPEGVGTISTPGKPNSENFFFPTFWTPNPGFYERS